MCFSRLVASAGQFAETDQNGQRQIRCAVPLRAMTRQAKPRCKFCPSSYINGPKRTVYVVPLEMPSMVEYIYSEQIKCTQSHHQEIQGRNYLCWQYNITSEIKFSC
jgi:hypothetical protein